MHIAGSVFGTDNGNNPFYLFYSGVFTVICVLASLVVNLYVNLRRNNCHEPRCFRLGRFPVDDQPYKTCHRHNPSPPTRGSIRHRYHIYIGDRPGKG